jgi:hypothetical protein
VDSNQIVAKVIDALDQLGVASMLVGSYSSNYYGRARATKDADFVIQIDQQSMGGLIPILGSGFKLDPRMSFESVTGTMRYILVHEVSAFKIEFFLLSSDAHDQARFQRRRPVQFLDRTVQLPTPEDVIITKLRWSKGGNRQKDVDDVRNVLAVQLDHLDFAYMYPWCDQHGTRQLLDALVADVKAQL